MPLSGSAGYQNQSHDIDVHIFGRDHGALVGEVKARARGQGFKTLEAWLGENDLLFLIADRREPIVTMHWRVWVLILQKLKK